MENLAEYQYCGFLISLANKSNLDILHLAPRWLMLRKHFAWFSLWSSLPGYLVYFPYIVFELFQCFYLLMLIFLLLLVIRHSVNVPFLFLKWFFRYLALRFSFLHVKKLCEYVETFIVEQLKVNLNLHQHVYIYGDLLFSSIADVRLFCFVQICFCFFLLYAHFISCFVHSYKCSTTLSPLDKLSVGLEFYTFLQ